MVGRENYQNELQSSGGGGNIVILTDSGFYANVNHGALVYTALADSIVEGTVIMDSNEEMAYSAALNRHGNSGVFKVAYFPNESKDTLLLEHHFKIFLYTGDYLQRESSDANETSMIISGVVKTV